MSFEIEYEKARPHYLVLASEDEFKNDVRKVTNIKKILSRYQSTGKINSQLLLNRLRYMFNVFDADFLIDFLFRHVRRENHIFLNTFLVYLDKTPYAEYDERLMKEISGV
jgi:hypothetical protein